MIIIINKERKNYMKKKLLVFGMIVVLLMSMVVLTACEKTESTSEETKSTTGSVEESKETEEETMQDYTFKEFSFKLPSNYKLEDGDDEDTAIYSDEHESDKMRVFSVSTISAQGVDFIATAEESLGEYDFKLPGYDIISKSEPKTEEFNGVKTISVDVKSHQSTLNGNSEIQYYYAQKDDTVYVISLQIYAQNDIEITEEEFSKSYDAVKNSFSFAQ